MTVAGNITFEGSVGRLEGTYQPGERPSAAAVVCHPLPTHGGTMHNKVVFRVAKAFERSDHAVLRFNFRGVGRSQGTFSDGRGESDDVRAAIEWLAKRHPATPLVVAGFSFGCAVGLPVGAADSRVEKLVAVGVPTGRFSFEALRESRVPKLFVQGDRDPFGPLAELREGLTRVGKPWEHRIVAGADHFFEGRLAELESVVAGWLSTSGRDSGDV